MALQINYTQRSGANFPECYVRICSYSGNRHALALNVLYYADKAARDAGRHPIDRAKITVPYTSGDGDALAHAYSYMKAHRPSFAGAIDV